MTSPIVFVEPYNPPPPPASPFQGFQLLWRGWDGSEFDLTSSMSSIVVVREGGVRGLGMPEHERWSRSAPLVPGSTYLGHQVKDREVHLPVYIYGDGSSEGFLVKSRAFWKTMRPDREGTLVVVLPDGERRYLDCRFVDDADYSINLDPIQRGWELHGINLIADNPYWYGDLATAGASTGISADWMDPNDSLFMTISSGQTLASAKVSNPGDIDAHPTWWLHGPFVSAQVGFGSRLVDVPFSVAAGKTLVVNTHPTSRSAKLVNSPALDAQVEVQIAQVKQRLLTATDRTKDLGASSNLNGKVPAGGRQQVNVTLVGGTGSIRLLLTPQYFRAW